MNEIDDNVNQFNGGGCCDGDDGCCCCKRYCLLQPNQSTKE